MTLAAAEALLRRRKLHAFPVAVKIDISPLCNIRCTVCVHARPDGNPALERQHFDNSQKMPVEGFRQIIDEIRGRSNAVSLFFLGDPLMHPHCIEMCRIASEAGLAVQNSSNFSYRLSDEQIENLVASGVSHLRVCIDGLSQETYSRTRVGGQIELVLSNIRRLCAVKRKLRRKFPRIEVQYIKFQHNIHEYEATRALCEELGVDQFTSFWGNLLNYVDANPGTYRVYGPKKRRRLVPNCIWPYFATVIKYNGDVLPCCNYRQGLQYIPGGDCRPMGNVFRTSLKEVWNSPAYQELRRMVWNPGLAQQSEAYRKTFCECCPNLFETDVPEKRGTDYTFEQLYTLDENRVPVRRAEILQK